jgi:hypothetical protein
MKILKENDAEDIHVVGGGIIPFEDIPALKKAGIKEVFQPGTQTDDILRYITANVKSRAWNPVSIPMMVCYAASWSIWTPDTTMTQTIIVMS